MKKMIIFLVTGAIFLCVSQSAARDSNGNVIVVIDAGHGGSDQGVRISNSVQEKHVTLAIAKLLKSELEGAGKFKAIMTRNSDETVSPADRLRISRDKQSDIYIGIHVNSGFSRTASGFEMYFPGFKAPGAEGNGSGEVVNDMVRTQYLNESVKLSQIIGKHMEKLFPRRDRGLREAPIITRQLPIPAVVIEIGFASNAREKKDLTDAGIQKSIAAELGKGIREYAR